jgi:hypothetical protein
MELTPEKVREIMNALLLKAKQNRAQIPYSKTDGIPPGDRLPWPQPRGRILRRYMAE